MKLVLAITLLLCSILEPTMVLAEQDQVPQNCQNKPNYYVHFHTPYLTRSESCAWIGQNNPALCFQEDVDGVLIGNQCPGQCPTVSGCPVQPTTKPPTKVPYGVPTRPPSKPPMTASASQFPTVQLQSPFPTKQPTLSPSGRPTTVFTAFPTVLPTVLPSVDPSAEPTSVRTETPSLAPTVKPSKQPMTTPLNPPISFTEDAGVSIEPSIESITSTNSNTSSKVTELELSTTDLTMSIVNAKRLTKEEVNTLTHLMRQWFNTFYTGNIKGIQRQCISRIEFIRQKMAFNSDGMPTNAITYKQTITFTYNQTVSQKEGSFAESHGPAEHPDDKDEEQNQITDVGDLTPEQIAVIPFQTFVSNTRLGMNLRHYIESFRDIEIPLGIPQVHDGTTVPMVRGDVTSGSPGVALWTFATLVLVSSVSM